MEQAKQVLEILAAKLHLTNFDDEEKEEYILTPEEEKSAVDHAIRSAKEHFQFLQLEKGELLGNIENKIANINWEEEINKDELLKRCNSNKHQDLWFKEQRKKEAEQKKKKMLGIKGYINLELILLYIKYIYTLLNMNTVSVNMLKIKNERFLNDARKEFYRVLQLFEEIVGKDIDRMLKENEEYLAAINKLNPQQTLALVKELHVLLQKIMDALGESSKWKWSFVELQGRVAVITKNMINFSELQKYRDPRKAFYYERQDMLKLCKQSLSEAAKQYRNKYEISTKSTEDILKSIELLTALRRIHILFGESDEAEKLKNTIEALRLRLEADEKEEEEKKKKK